MNFHWSQTAILHCENTFILCIIYYTLRIYHIYNIPFIKNCLNFIFGFKCFLMVAKDHTMLFELQPVNTISVGNTSPTPSRKVYCTSHLLCYFTSTFFNPSPFLHDLISGFRRQPCDKPYENEDNIQLRFNYWQQHATVLTPDISKIIVHVLASDKSSAPLPTFIRTPASQITSLIIVAAHGKTYLQELICKSC